MATLSLTTVAKHMKKLDICMMITMTRRGFTKSRPVSNKKDVAYKGDSFFFTCEKSGKIKKLEANENLRLVFEG